MTAVSRGEITITNVNDGKTPYFHTAYSWSKDGTDRFATIYPQDNKLENTQNPSVTKPVQLKGSRTSNTETITMNNGITRQEKQVDKTGEFYYRFMNTADNNLSAVDLTPGKTYHFGLDLRAELAEGDYITWRAQYKTATSSWINMDNWGASFSKIEGVTSEFQRFERELTIPEDATTLYFSYQVYSPNSTSPSVGTVVEFKNAKFALDSASPYTPSPEEDLANAYPTYLGTYSSFEEEDSLSPYDYTWSLIKGSDGKDGENGIPGIPGEDGRTPYFHTAYINSTDFGAYDYSGNPNLMANINADSFSQGAGALSVVDDGDEVVVTLDPNNKLELYKVKSQPALIAGKTYTMSVEIMLEDDFTGDPSKIGLKYFRMPQWVPALTTPNTLTTAKGVWQKLTVTAKMTTAIDKAESWYILLYNLDSNNSLSGKLRLRHAKIEESSTATPYQPNIKGAPWYFSTVPLGKNIADPTVSFPIKTSAYRVYGVNMLEEFKIGQRYTLTMKATKPASQTFWAYNGENISLERMTPVEGLTDVWSCSFTILKIDSSSPRLLSIYQKQQSTVGACQIDWLKIEKGNTRTPNIDNYKYLGNYTDFEQADSPNPTKYSWSLIKGADGETSHVHTAYAWSADGTKRFTKKYPRENLALNNRIVAVYSNNGNIAPIQNTTMTEDGETFVRTVRTSPDLNPTTFSVYNGISIGSETNANNKLLGHKIEVSGMFRASRDSEFTMMFTSVARKTDGKNKDIHGNLHYKKVNVTKEWKQIGGIIDLTNTEGIDSLLTLRCIPFGTVIDPNEGFYLDSKNYKVSIIDDNDEVVTTYTTPPTEDYENAYPTYTGIYSDLNIEGSDNPKDYTWARSIGSTGESAKTLILSTSSNTVKINQDSSIQSDTITLQANMQNMVGIATFSATPYIGTTPQTAITLGGTGNTRTFSTLSWNKNWTSLVVTATFESFIDKQTIISVKEGKDGTDSITGLLTNESVTLAADKNGTVESFSEASGTFKVFDGLSDVTGRNVAYRLKSSLGGTFNINASTGVYNMTAMSKDSATATFEATYKNIKIEKILNVAKSKAGKETYTYTKYSNSKDFGDYDYSGNPNLLSNITNDSWTAEGAMKVTAVGDYLELVKDTPGRYGIAKIHNIPGLRTNSQYTTSLEVYLKSGTSVEDLKRCNIAIEATNTSGQVFYSVIYMSDIPKMDEWVDLTSTFTTNTYTDNLTNWKFRVYVHPDVSVSMRIKNNIKIEKGNKATPYQPNLLDEPWYISNVPVGENIRRLDAGNQPPLTTTEYNCYIGRINGYWKAGETYTITVEGTKPATQTFGLYLLNGSQHAGDLSPVEGLPDTWSLTFTPTKEMIDVGVTNHANIFQVPQSTKGEVRINSVKIEKGKYRTPEIDPYKYMGVYVGGES